MATFHEEFFEAKLMEKAWRRIGVLEAALKTCATVAGADMSDGIPTWPPLEVFAVQAVARLRADYDA